VAVVVVTVLLPGICLACPSTGPAASPLPACVCACVLVSGVLTAAAAGCATDVLDGTPAAPDASTRATLPLLPCWPLEGGARLLRDAIDGDKGAGCCCGWSQAVRGRSVSSAGEVDAGGGELDSFGVLADGLTVASTLRCRRELSRLDFCSATRRAWASASCCMRPSCSLRCCSSCSRRARASSCRLRAAAQRELPPAQPIPAQSVSKPKSDPRDIV
jgi:hypothetical protein